MILIEKLILRECLSRTTIVLVGILSLFIVFDALESARVTLLKNQGLVYFIWKIVLEIPSRFYELLPLAVLLGCIWAISIFAKSSELTVIRVSGYLIKRLIILLFLFGAGFGVVGVFVDEVIDNIAYTKRQVIISQSNPTTGTNVWIRYRQNFVNIKNLNQNNAQNITSITINKDFTDIEKVLFAQSGIYVPANKNTNKPAHWLLKDVDEINFTIKKPDNITTNALNLESSPTTVPEVSQSLLAEFMNNINTQNNLFNRQKLPQLEWQGAPEVEIILSQEINPQRLKLLQLVPLYKFNLDNLLRFEALAVNMWKKINYPLVVALMAIIGIPFCLKTGRQIAANFRVLIGILVGIAFFVFQGIFANLGIISLPPIIGVIFPILLFLILTLFGVWWAQRL